MGVDEFTDANNTMPAWNYYSQDLNSVETGANQPVWDNFYGLVEPANINIANMLNITIKIINVPIKFVWQKAIF